MDSGILVNIIETGTVAFLGSKITKAFAEKEISEIIAGCGWLAVSIEVLKLVTPVIKGVENFGKGINGFFAGCDNFVKGLSNIPWFGEIIKRGMINR